MGGTGFCFNCGEDSKWHCRACAKEMCEGCRKTYHTDNPLLSWHEASKDNFIAATYKPAEQVAPSKPTIVDCSQHDKDSAPCRCPKCQKDFRFESVMPVVPDDTKQMIQHGLSGRRALLHQKITNLLEELGRVERSIGLLNVTGLPDQVAREQLRRASLQLEYNPVIVGGSVYGQMKSPAGRVVFGYIEDRFCCDTPAVMVMMFKKPVLLTELPLEFGRGNGTDRYQPTALRLRGWKNPLSAISNLTDLVSSDCSAEVQLKWESVNHKKPSMHSVENVAVPHVRCSVTAGLPNFPIMALAIECIDNKVLVGRSGDSRNVKHFGFDTPISPIGISCK